MKKIISLGLALLIMLSNLTCAYASNTPSGVDDAIDFLESKYLPVGIINNVVSVDDELIFTVCYLENELSQIKFKETEDAVFVTYIETRAQNVFEFRKDGTIYVDGIYDEELTYSLNECSLTYQYASGYYERIPDGMNPSFGGTSTSTGYITLATTIASYTTAALAQKLAIKFCSSLRYSSIFLAASRILIDYAINYAVSATGLSYSLSTRTDSSQAPFQYLYENTSTLTLLSKTTSKTYYKIETLL